MGNISNVCCEGPIDIGTNNHDFNGLVFEPSVLPELENELVKQRIVQFANRPLIIPTDKYQNIKDKAICREVTKNFVYDGTWKSDLPEGLGKILFHTGQYFQGQFKEGKAQGNGRFVFQNGDYFEGDIHNNRAQGQGKYYGNLIQYCGQWQNSRPTIGSYKLLKNDTIVSFNSQNQGQIKWTNGNIYKGQIKNFLPDGTGKMLFNDGSIYQGDWSNGNFNGKGTFRWPNGKAYIGEYVNGVKQGHGQFIYSPSRRYVGEWHNGKQNGQGKLFQNEEESYSGLFENGIPVNIPNSDLNSSL